jgi:hypothetical protein
VGGLTNVFEKVDEFEYFLWRLSKQKLCGNKFGVICVFEISEKSCAEKREEFGLCCLLF